MSATLELAPPPIQDEQPSEPEVTIPNNDAFGRVGVEGIRQVLQAKLDRERELEPSRSPEDKARDAIATLEDPRAKSALLGELTDVTNVMKAVETLRAHGTEEHPITDRDIYISYRKLAETENPDPRFVKACQILLNFMGGNVSGKLPF